MPGLRESGVGNQQAGYGPAGRFLRAWDVFVKELVKKMRGSMKAELDGEKLRIVLEITCPRLG